MPLDFPKAIQVAGERITEFVPGAKHPEIEEAVISKDGKLYEITFNYEVPPKKNSLESMAESQIAQLTNLLRQRREKKTFLVDAEDFTFRGFRRYRDE